ncbi:HD domain-containing phosphohydrolase [Bordetella sp. H567]|uniref:HD domain-containing phosphohydrolase n=1 Tax=Bordetella sp. H567 TaxID=1697043 RepID=UPI000A496AF0|nr:HD domain-containing phosphohydrolase [Bordetella sp. H567]
MHVRGNPVPVFDGIRALAFIGDLSMGQPTDHSPRVARLACHIARAAGLGDDVVHAVQEAGLLRWSGCTANASGFADVLGDDVLGREAMLAMRPGWSAPLARHGGAAAAIRPLAEVHCEVSGQVAAMLRLSGNAQHILRNVFEAWDGSGQPGGLRGAAVPLGVFVVALAGDLEIYARVYGVSRARELIRGKADAAYPADLADIAMTHAEQWMRELDDDTSAPEGLPPPPSAPQAARSAPASTRSALESTQGVLTPTPSTSQPAPLELIADIIDLKLPWMTGYSRAVADAAAACALRLATDEDTLRAVYRAGLVHGIGRAAVPNAIWDTPGRLSAPAWEKVRLVPYWTARAGKQTGSLADAAELGSYAYERADGSGYFRAIGAPAVGQSAQILAASVAWVALRSPRPWRAALPDDAAAACLRDEADRGRFDRRIVDALTARSPAQGIEDAPAAGTPASGTDGVPRADNALLTPRERDVLRAISRGSTNKEVARLLALSPSTVRTHVENAFRKLECSTRAAATLKASALGLL